MGYFLPDKAEIYIDKSLSPQQRLSVLLHECLEAIFEYSTNEKVPYRHDVIEIMEQGLFSLLTENPSLLRLFLKKEKQK